MARDFVAYYRVSKENQSKELSAQKEAVNKYLIDRHPAIKDYTDIADGSKASLPEFKRAVEHCKQRYTTLLVAKLGHMSRDINFIEGLSDNIDFVCCDMPEASRKNIGIILDMVRFEHKKKADRIKAGLATKRKAGVPLGANNPKVKAGLLKWRQRQVLERVHKAKATIQSNTPALKEKKPTKQELADQKIIPSLKTLINAGYSYKRMAYAFNLSSTPTRRRKRWTAVQIFRVVKRNKLK